MRDLLHHTPESRSIGTLHDPVHLLETQRSHNHLVLHGSANDAPNQFDLNGPWHVLNPPSPLPDHAAGRLHPCRATVPAHRSSPSPHCEGCANRAISSAHS